MATADAPEPGLRLVVLGEARCESHPLPPAGRVTIGRSRAADLPIDDDSLSRMHAALHVGEGLELEDLGSTNGTFLDGRRLRPRAREPVEPGALVELGSLVVLIQGRPSRVEAAAGARSPMARLRAVAERVASSELSVLLIGETGVGKEVLARSIHARSRRASGPFVAINCGALPDQLIESELFGHKAGAFTGAAQTRVGLLESASGGTVFLDELGELPASAQVKLLRVLEAREVRRLGEARPRPIDVRLVAATHRDLRREAQSGGFRRDLYYRINGITLTIPALRERLDELPGLVETFAREEAGKLGLSRAPRLSTRALSRLRGHAWPGNIRELRNVIARAVVLAGDDEIDVTHIDLDEGPPPAPAAPESDERARIIEALRQSAGNQTRAAKLLGISRKTLGLRLDTYGIPRPRKGARR